MLKTTPPTAEPTPDVALTQVKHRRRPLLWVVAALLIAVGALLSGAVVNMVKDTVPVVVASRDIPRGAQLTVEDLATVDVHPDPALRTTPADGLPTLVGQTAMVDLPQGALLVPGSTGSGITPTEGQSLVGVALTPPQMPAGGLKQGQVVQLISTPRQGDDVVADAPVIDVEAMVVTTEAVIDTNMTVVNVTVDADQAPLVATLSATGRLALIVKGA